jgi:drug/metabolite transporter (DMT)-like permease
VKSVFQIIGNDVSSPSALDARPPWFLYSTILFHQIVIAVAFPIAKLGLNEIEPYSYAFLRFTISSLIYIPVLFFLRRTRRIALRDHVKIFVIGFILILLNQVIFLVGQSLTSAGHASLLFATVPIFLYILALIFLRERPGIRRAVGIMIAAAGVYVILAGGMARFGRQFLFGDLLVLIAVIAWAVATVMAKPLAVKYGAFRVTGLALVYGSLVYLPFGLYKVAQFSFEGLSRAAWFSVFYMAVVVSLLAYFLWYWVLKYMEVSRVAVIQNIQPVIASAVAAMLLAEPISQRFVIGGIIVIAGVILTELR